MAKKSAKKADYYDNEEDEDIQEDTKHTTARNVFPSEIPEYADDVDAAEKGLPLNGLYRTGSVLKVRVC